jgi:hypothetical protein
VTRAAHRPAALARSAGVCSAVWSGGFTALHAYWALGGRGSGPQEVDAAFARTGFAVYNGVVTLLCLVGVAAAAGLAVATRLPRRVVRAARTVAWSACVLLLVRGGVGVGVGQGLLGLAPPAERLAAYDFDPWFLLGGVLFGIAAGCGRRRSDGGDDG